MKLLIEKIPNLQSLYVKQLRMLLSAEETIAVKTRFMANSASDPHLNAALRQVVEESEAHALRLKEILQRTVGRAEPIKCKVIFALFDEAEDLSQDSVHPNVRDAVLIASAQRIKHYEIASYGAVREFARVLDRDRDAELLDQAIEEEGRADRMLTKIADTVNPSARTETHTLA